jgi:hypothetical protein
MLKGVLKPNWQHPDIEIRRRAVGQLPAAESAILEQVLREDQEPAIRRVAVRRCTNLELLAERAASDPDASVREQAGKRHGRLLSGRADDAPPLAVRLEAVRRLEHQALLERLAREGVEIELREQALEKVERMGVLRDVALNDAHIALRLRALECIDDEPTLVRIQQQSRKRDKRVHHRASEKLEALIAAREQPHRDREQCQHICAAVEELGGGNWQREHTLLGEFEREWMQIEQAHRAEFEQRFASARQGFLDALAIHQHTVDEHHTAAIALVEDLEALVETAGKERPEALETRLREVSSSWDRLPALAGASGQVLQVRFESAQEAVGARVVALRREAELGVLRKAGETLLARKGVIGEREVKALERRREALPPPGSEHDLSFDHRVNEILGTLRDRLRSQVKRKQTILDCVPNRLEELKAALAEKDAARAGALHDEIAKDLDALVTMGVSKRRLGKLPKMFEALAREVKVVRSWDRFGAGQARERLCEAMEALIGAADPPQETARRIREARAEWNDLNARDPDVNQALWRRFDRAAHKAHEPCEEYFAARAATRRANLEKRRALAERLEAFLAATDWSAVDWKATVRFHREALAEWRHASPVDRKAGKSLERRWQACLKTIQARLDTERQRCLRARERLIEQVSALHKSPDPRRAAEECKSLQRQWTTTVPASRGRENALWQRFRVACDGVFDERHKALNTERERSRANLESRLALCERAEALAESSAAQVDEAIQALHRLQAEWRQLGAVPSRDGTAAEKRFASAVRRFRERREALAADARRADLEVLEHKAALCQQAEALRQGNTPPEASAFEALEAHWQTLPAQVSPEHEQILRERFERALQGIQDDAAEAAARQERESLCLRMEILAEIDSPPEFRQARMAYQVERLATSMSGEKSAAGDDLESLRREWCLAGPAPRAAAEALQRRFRRARDTLIERPA